MQLDSTHSVVSNNNEITHTTEAVNKVNIVDTTSVSSPHLLIRKRATEKYLAIANKRIQAYKEYVANLSSSYSSGDYDGIKIHKIFRTNIDPKILPPVIVEINDR